MFHSALRDSDEVGLLGTNGVADGAADTEEVIGPEFYVVLNVIVVNFRAHKKIVPNVVADAATDMLHEVIAAGVVNAAGKVAAGGCEGHVKAGAGNADAAHQVEANLLIETWLVDSVEVGEDGAVAFITVIAGLASPPGSLDVEPEAALETHNIAAHAQVGSTLLRQWAEGLGTAAVGAGLRYGVAAERNVALLGGGEVAREQHSNNGSKKR